MKKAVAACVLAIALAACKSPNAPDDVESLSLTRLGSAQSSFTTYSGLRDAQRVVIRDQAAWQQTWNAIWSGTGSSPVPALPAIDFTREMVIVAALGERPTGGFSIFVESASETADSVTINVRRVSPGNGCAVTLAFTRPVDIARMTRRDGVVVFNDTAMTQNC